MKSLSPRKFLSVCLVMALLLSMMVLQGGLASEYLVAEETVLTPFTGSISLDVNPSIELKIENGIVTQALAYNDDGQSLLSDSSLTGLTAEEAVKAMTKTLVEGGYLASADSTPYLVITVSGSGAQEEDAAEALQNAVKHVAEELGTEFEIRSAFVPEDVAAQAAAAGLSAGKYLLLTYIAKTEDISFDEAVAKYGAAKISDLMNQFEDADEVFDSDGFLLTEEQRAALESAFARQKESITAAEKNFHDAFKALKNAYRVKVRNAIKARKGADAQALADTLNQLKEQMLAEYQTVRQALDDAVSAARAAFLEVVTAAGIPEEISSQYYTWHMNKELNAEGELNAFLKEFTYKAEDKEDQDETLIAENQGSASEEEGLNEQDEDQAEDKDEYQDEDKIKDQDGDQDGAQDQDEDQDGAQDQDEDQDGAQDQDEDKIKDQDEDQDGAQDQDEDKIKEQDEDQNKIEDEDRDMIEDQDEDKDKDLDEDQGGNKSNKSSTQSSAASQGRSGGKGNNGNSGKGKK